MDFRRTVPIFRGPGKYIHPKYIDFFPTMLLENLTETSLLGEWVRHELAITQERKARQ